MMKRKIIVGLAGVAVAMAQPAWGAVAAEGGADEAALAQCVVMRTSGADRLLTARWLFAVMSKSPQIDDLSAVTSATSDQLDRAFAALLTRIVVKDCLDEVRPLIVIDAKKGFGSVGRALGEIAMKELLGTKEVDQGVGAYAKYISEAELKPLIDSVAKASGGKR